jgi:hypothetical protein
MIITKLTSAIKEYRRYADVAIWDPETFANGRNLLMEKISELSEKSDISDISIHIAMDTISNRYLNRDY